MGKRGPLAKKLLVGGQYLAAKAAAEADHRQHDVDELLTAPGGITKGARRRWDALAPLLHQDRRLRPDTREALVVYCKVADQEEELSQQLVQEGAVLSSAHGSYANPLHKIVQGLRSQMLRYQACLGLDPSARARLESAGTIEPDAVPMDADDALMFR